jgi:hypothetical protein
MKLVKVMDGIYRNAEGTVSVTHKLAWKGKSACWRVAWTDGLGCRKENEFPTLARAREFLKRLN